MTRPLRNRLALAASLATLGLIGACSDEPTRPAMSSAPQPHPSFAIDAAQRGRLGAALHFAREQSLRGLLERDAADRVAGAFASLAARVEADDRIGAERALATARAAVDRYAQLARRDGGAALADLDAMALTLDHAALLVRETARPPLADDASAAGHATTTRTTNRELQP